MREYADNKSMNETHETPTPLPPHIEIELLNLYIRFDEYENEVIEWNEDDYYALMNRIDEIRRGIDIYVLDQWEDEIYSLREM